MNVNLKDDLKLLRNVISKLRKKLKIKERYHKNKNIGATYYQRNKAKRKEYIAINKEKIIKRKKLNYIKNKEDRNKKSRHRYNNNREARRQYLIKNRDKTAKTHNEYIKNRKKNDINFKLTVVVRSRISNALNGNFKSGSSIGDLGCSVEYFRHYIEGKFLPGMTWDNYGLYGWHLDHIIPLASFNLSNREEFLKACHYTNYQPLWAIDNLRKNDKIQ